MAGMQCPGCRELTLHRNPKGAECSNCNLKIVLPANGGKGGKGMKCPFCKLHTLFDTIPGKAKCRSCGAQCDGLPT